MKKLKSLLMPGHIPRLPPIPKFVGGNRGREPRALVHLAGGMTKIGYESSGPRPIGPRPIGGRKGGMTVTEKMQLLSPKEKASLESQQRSMDYGIKGAERRVSSSDAELMKEKQSPLSKYGMGRKGGRSMSMMTAVEAPGPVRGMGRKPKKVGGASCGGKKPSARGAIVKKVMREQGLSLPQASKYVKEHGLY